MSNQTCSGWTNKATWNVALAYEETFKSICEEQAGQLEDAWDVAEAFKSIVEELELQPLEHLQNGLAYQLVSDALSQVNWLELGQHFGEEMIIAQLEEEEAERLNNCTMIAD